MGSNAPLSISPEQLPGWRRAKVEGLILRDSFIIVIEIAGLEAPDAGFGMIRKNRHQKKEFGEQLVQKFPHRCPYCDQPISYDLFDLKEGENVIQCRSCKKTYIKVVSNSHEERG